MIRFTILALLALVEVNGKTPDNVSSKLMIHIPHSLSKDEGYDHREALFGMPPYGGSIAQNLYYAESNLCDPNVDTRKGYPERKYDEDGKMEPWPSPYILMVDRGGCTFVKKVRNAQRSGAAGVIIADNACLCSDTECMRDSLSQECESSEPIMADDGSGSDISIPSFLMFKRDADKVKDELRSNHPVQIEMAWSLPTPDDRVEYDLWSVPSDVVSKDFLSSFKDVAVRLGDKAQFTPHNYIYDGVRSHCVGNNGENMCYNLCTNNGRYCATDPDNDLEHGISGADVVRESLRRLCIWSHYGEDGVGAKWWDYVMDFMRRCDTEEFFMNERCVRDSYKHAKIDGSLIDRCMKDSGGVDEDKSNVILEAEIATQTTRGVVVLPTAFVNTAAIRGALSVSNVFKAICAGYVEGTVPSICHKCSSCGDPAECARLGVCKKGPKIAHSGGVSASTFVFTLLLVVAVFGGLGVYHYKRTRDEMRDHVRGILAEYMPLEDQEGENSNPMDFAQRGGNVSLIS